MTRGGFSLMGVLTAPFQQVAAMVWRIVSSIPDLWAHHEELMGIVGIVAEGGRAAATGRGLELALSLTLSLAILNLLPIPVLDGGQIVMSCLEKLVPRSVSLRVPLTLAGMLALAALMIYSNTQDIVRLWL